MIGKQAILNFRVEQRRSSSRRMEFSKFHSNKMTSLPAITRYIGRRDGKACDLAASASPTRNQAGERRDAGSGGSRCKPRVPVRAPMQLRVPCGQPVRASPSRLRPMSPAVVLSKFGTAERLLPTRSTHWRGAPTLHLDEIAPALDLDLKVIAAILG